VSFSQTTYLSPCLSAFRRPHLTEANRYDALVAYETSSSEKPDPKPVQKPVQKPATKPVTKPVTKPAASKRLLDEIDEAVAEDPAAAFIQKRIIELLDKLDASNLTAYESCRAQAQTEAANKFGATRQKLIDARATFVAAELGLKNALDSHLAAMKK